MNDIEFLPSDYVCVQVTRNNNNWLRCVFALALMLMAIGWTAQQRSIRELTARRNQAQAQANVVLSQMESAEQLASELQKAVNSQRLLDGLRSQLPPTRWLAAIIGALPINTTLAEIHSEVDDGTEISARADVAGGIKSADVNPPTDLLLKDLERLAKLTPRRSLTITVRGAAVDDLEVSKFLSALHKSEIFERIQLLFTDHLHEGNKTLRSFAIRLRTKPFGSKPASRPPGLPVATAILDDRQE